MRILLITLFLINSIYGSIAVVSAFKGKANILRDEKMINVLVGTELEIKDKIRTFDNTRIQLIFKDNTRITIGKNSSFSVEDYLYDETHASKSKAQFKFTKGLFRTISGRIGKINKKQFKIQVKNGTIGIRGTQFDVYATSFFVKVGVYEGAIYFNKYSDNIDVEVNELFIYDYASNKVEIKIEKLEESVEFDEHKDKELKDIEVEKIQTEDESEFPIVSDESPNEQITTIEENIDSIIDLNQVDAPIDSDDNNNAPSGNGPSGVDISPNDNYEKEIIDNGIDSDDIPDLEYGYWQDPDNSFLRVDTFITGLTTPEDVITNKIGTASIASYSGGISSIITNNAGDKISSDGTIDLTIDFDIQTLNGKININNGLYKASIDNGIITSSDFSSTSISDDSGNIEVTSGSLNGNYYGASGSSVGGAFLLNGIDNSKVEGKFGAKQ